MNTKTIKVSDKNEIIKLRSVIHQSIGITYKELSKKIIETNPFDFFYQVRFSEEGKEPLSGNDLNFIEQLNQTFTYLVTLTGAEYLLDTHSDKKPYTLHLGNVPGPDIISYDGSVIAAAFAAVDADNNRKLLKEIKKLEQTNAQNKYIFYYADIPYSKLQRTQGLYPDVRIIAIDMTKLHP